MRAYLLTTGTVFGLFAAEHLVLLVRRWQSLTSDPSFVLGVAAIFAATAGLTAWAIRLLKVHGSAAP